VDQAIDTSGGIDVKLGLIDENPLYFKGAMDDVRIYSRALSDNEIMGLSKHPNSGLVAHWELDDDSGSNTAIDSFGDYDGTVSGATFQPAGGQIDGALSFDGVDDYVDIDTVAGSADVDEGTIATWIKFDASHIGDNTTHGLIEIGNYTSGNYFIGLRKISDESIRLRYRANATNYDATLTIATHMDNPTGWHHITGVWTADKVRIYLDGQEIDEQDRSATAGTLDYARIGKTAQETWHAYVNADFDDVHIYSQALELTEIKQLVLNNPHGAGIQGNDTQATISQCVIRDNVSQGNGGGIYNCNGLISRCQISHNSADQGGALAACQGEVSNCLINSNESLNSGSAFYNCDVEAVNCTIASNLATSGSVLDSCSGAFTNTIIWGNSPDTFASHTATMTYSCWPDGTSGTNISTDPCFVDSDNSDYHLKFTSLCVNAGDSGGDYSDQFDIDGEYRLMDNNVDIGADEFLKIWYVDKMATDSNEDGSSWEDAFLDLQDALSAAGAAVGGREIWVAEGTYTPSGDDKDVSFEMVEDVALYGGFSGTETGRNQRDWFANETILSGDMAGVNDPCHTDNTKQIVIGADNAIIDGFTITRGYGSKGAGMYNNGVSVTISNCTFTFNDSNSNNGGAICNENGCQIAISNCLFIENKSRSGGGIYNSSSTLALNNCVFDGNIANGSYLMTGSAGGGGLYLATGTNSILTNCIFYDNQASASGGYGGGIYIRSSGDNEIINCVIVKNSALKGGGIALNESSPDIINTIIYHNTTTEDEYPEIHGIQDMMGMMGCSQPEIISSNVGGTGGSDSWTGQIGGQGFLCTTGSLAVDGGGNIDADPKFVNIDDLYGPDGVIGTEDDGLRLLSDSPCVDQINITLSETPATDLAGQGRVDIPYIPNGSDYIADMGVYESAILWFVDTDATGLNNGSTWTDAFVHLQDALTSATQYGGDIWVAAGTYYPDRDNTNPTGTGNRSASFDLIDDVGIYGGFTGEEVILVHRIPDPNLTILSGALDENNNSYHVVSSTANNTFAILDGFAIIKGYADGDSGNDFGGGIYIIGSSSPKIINCSIRDNYAALGGGSLCSFEQFYYPLEV